MRTLWYFMSFYSLNVYVNISTYLLIQVEFTVVTFKWDRNLDNKEYLFLVRRALQEAQDIFGVDFDYDEFGKYGEEDYEEEEEEEEDEYMDEDIDTERARRPKKQLKKKTTRKSIFEIYEPSELKRGHFTDMDNEVRIIIC